MNFLHAYFLLGLLLPALSTPDLPHALARLSEARARALTNRARLRANSARVLNQVRNNQNRVTPNRSKRQDYPPPPPNYEEPTFVHICSMEGDAMERSAESGEDFHLVEENSAREAQNEDSRPSLNLNQALGELIEARKLLNRFEKENEGNREAEAHRSHFHQHVHSHGSLPQTQIINPGLPITQTQFVTPGLHQGLLNGHVINHGVQISPIHGGIIPNQGIFSSRLREAEDDRQREVEESELEQIENDLSAFEDQEREANPTLHKIKKLKQKLNQKFDQGYSNYGPQPQYYNHYREVEDSEEREANPTLHKIKKLKQKLNQKYDQGYLNYGPQSQLYSHYREVEDSEEREASPTLHKKMKLKQKLNQKFNQGYSGYAPQSQYYGQYREAEEPEENFEDMPYPSPDLLEDNFPPDNLPHSQYPTDYRESENVPVSSSFLFDVPSRRLTDYKRSVDDDLNALLGVQRQIIDTMKEKSQNDEDLKFLTDISNRTFTSIEAQKKKITKRSIPLTRLINDPNVRLDVPKTFENFGTATKHAFEDERAPMYHLKHLVGSSKNALLSAMRIPPQNMIIPSDYEIVKASERPWRSRSRDTSDDPITNTFKRVGEMVRDSFRSGQETVSHISDAAHEARNVLNSARHSAPRLIVPYSKVPAIKKSPHKAILITPRILDLAESHSLRKSGDSKPNFIRLGHLIDAVGLSKPNARNLDLEKIILEPWKLPQTRTDEEEVVEALEDAKISVGAKNLRDLLLKMRNELTNVVSEEPKKKKHKSKKKHQQETKEMGKFIETLFDGTQDQKEETVGDMMLPPELLRPFMGRASDHELNNFLRDNGDDTDQMEIQKKHKTPKTHFENAGNRNNSDLGYVLGAINPLMFERMFNQTVAPHPEITGRNGEEKEENVGTVMTLNGPMLKPFMGQPQEQAVENFLDTYNADPNENFVDFEEMDK